MNTKFNPIRTLIVDDSQFQDREMFPYPDLVLLDFCMPRCSGIGVLRFLQGQFHRPRVVLWSNTMERLSLPLAFRLGADMVCRKPTRKQELMEILSRIQARVFRQSPAAPPEPRIISTLSGQHIASTTLK
jgi:CheY-like chemotaxis protein